MLFNIYKTENGLQQYWVSEDKRIKVHPPGTKNKNQSWLVRIKQFPDPNATSTYPFATEERVIAWINQTLGEKLTFRRVDLPPPKSPKAPTKPANIKNRKMSL